MTPSERTWSSASSARSRRAASNQGPYVLVLAGFFLVTHGRTSPKWVGWVCILAAAGTAWLAFVPSGLIAMG